MTSEVVIESTKYASDRVKITDFVTPDGYQRFGVNAKEVDNCVFSVSSALEGYPLDVALSAVLVLFVMVVWRWGISIPGAIRFAENFLNSDDRKLGCSAVMGLLHRHFDKDYIVRDKMMKLSKAIVMDKLSGNVRYE
jgi:hypothetical protein